MRLECQSSYCRQQSSAFKHAGRQRQAQGNIFTSLTRHAYVRVRQRTSMTCEGVKSLIDQGLCVHTGVTPGTNKEHLAFYSQPDDAVFVAIHDYLRGRVISVLPLDYHRNLAWPITDSDCTKAKALVVDAVARLQKQEAEGAEAAGKNPSRKAPAFFVISATFKVDGSYGTKRLCKEPAVDYSDVIDFIKRSPIVDQLDQLAFCQGIDPAAILSLAVRHGNKGEPHVFFMV
jgi:hypothetical protein